MQEIIAAMSPNIPVAIIKWTKKLDVLILSNDIGQNLILWQHGRHLTGALQHQCCMNLARVSELVHFSLIHLISICEDQNICYSKYIIRRWNSLNARSTWFSQVFAHSAVCKLACFVCDLSLLTWGLFANQITQQWRSARIMPLECDFTFY